MCACRGTRAGGMLPVAEVSTVEEVQKAREEFEVLVKNERYFF